MVEDILDYPINFLNEISYVFPSLSYLIEFFNVKGSLGIA